MKKVFIVLACVLFFILSFGLIIRFNKINSNNRSSRNINQNTEFKSEVGVRKPIVSGSFYPSDSGELKKKVFTLLENSVKINFVGKPRILIVPHAGITYSGNVAASGFKQLEGQNNLRIILLGASHTSAFDYSAIDDNNFWETPLGKVEVDTDFVKTINNGQSIRIDKSIHLKEHSLEMELIFLQNSLSNFKIVPILMGQNSDELINLLAQKLAYNFDENTLLIVSSDLSHYPNWENANASDSELVGSILKGNSQDFEQTLIDISRKNYANLDTPACAKDAIRASLKFGELLGIKNFEKIKYENSGDVTKDKSRVVGYASILGYSDNINFQLPELDSLAKKESLEIARKTLENFISLKSVPDIKFESKILDEPLGVFVTLTKNGQLRGCIGEFEPSKPLSKVIQDTVISSATKDRRFSPVQFYELKDIEIEISVMTPRKKVGDWQSIRLGRDGVVVQKGINAGTFLPQVAKDNNWNLEKFLSELCSQKAGLPPDCYKDKSVDIYSFEVEVFRE